MTDLHPCFVEELTHTDQFRVSTPFGTGRYLADDTDEHHVKLDSGQIKTVAWELIKFIGK